MFLDMQHKHNTYTQQLEEIWLFTVLLITCMCVYVKGKEVVVAQAAGRDTKDFQIHLQYQLNYLP